MSAHAAPAPDVPSRTRGSVKARAKADAGSPGGASTGGIGRLIVRASLALIVVLWTVPTVGLLVSSFRTREAVNNSGWWTAFSSPLDFTQWTLENYDTVLSAGMGNAFVNSLAVSVPATVIPILAAAFAAYAFSWMEFKGREVLFVVFVALLVVPLQVALVPLLRIYSSLGITGTFLAVWLAHTGFGMPLAVYLLRNYIG
ncbi:MAG TPA: hypothetical protein VGA36_10150, partial [Nitriliruptorales bacterium]